jgi:ADP-ribose pyrophosphatase YjhB (NUDIX family)
MNWPFDEPTRRNIAARCAAFARLPAGDPAPALKRAAVAVTLVETDDGSGTALLLTRRAASLRTHRSQWALPGGRCDDGETLEQAALRELHEELGVELSGREVLGVLDDYVSRSGYVISPVVAWLQNAAAMVPNPGEVASVHRIRLDHIGREDAVEFMTIPESDRPVIRLHTGDGHIHAPTAALVYQLRELVAGRITRVADLEQPVFAWR